MKKVLLTFIGVLLLLTTINIGDVLAEDSYYINLGTPIYDSSSKSYFTFPDVSVTLSNTKPSVLSVTVSSGSITLPEDTDISGATKFYDMANKDGNHKSINFFWSSGVEKTTIETILKAIQFKYEDEMTITITMDGNTTNIADKLSNVEGATLTQWDGNGHYYLYVPYKQTSDPKYISWSEAYNAALDYKIAGMQGYLATLAEVGEQSYLSVLANSNVWVGGTSLVLSDGNTKLNGDSISLTQGVLTYAPGFYAAANSYKVTKRNTQTGDAYSPLVEYYYWACGPEAGEKIASCVKQNSIYNSDGEEIITLYNNAAARLELNGYPQGSANVVNYSKKIVAPLQISNDKNTNIDGEYENCTALYVGDKTGLNDITEGNFFYKDESTTALGYIVEFGDWTGHDKVDTTKVASFNTTLKNSDNSNPKIKVESTSIDVTVNNKTYDRANLSKTNITGVTVEGNSIDSDGYTIKYYDSNNNEISAPKDAGTYKVKVFVDNGTYIGESDYKEITISPISVTIFGLIIKDKQYDTTNTAEKSNATVYTINGLLSGDDVSVDDSEATYTFDSADKGENINVTVTDMKLKGTDSKNYTISSQPSANASIVDPKINIDGKQYDANSLSIDSVTRYDSNNSKVITVDPSKYENSIKWYIIVEGNEIELNKAPSDVGQYKVKLTIDGDDSYAGGEVSQVVTIVEKEATLTITPKSKEYDGNSNVLEYTYSFDGLINDGDITITNLTASYSDESIGNDKSIVNNTIDLGGNNIGNYTIKFIFNKGSITKRNITLKANDINVKVDESYDYSYTISQGSLLDKDTLSVKFAQSKPNSVGTYDIKILNVETDKDYYDISTINGKLTIVDKTSDNTSNTGNKPQFTCEGEHNSLDWTWSDSLGKCVYKVRNTYTR